MNVTVPSPENCTSPSLCWTDGIHTWTIKNVTHKENIAKCEWTQRTSHWDRLSGGGRKEASVEPRNRGKRAAKAPAPPLHQTTGVSKGSQQRKPQLRD